ncbi:Aste57867_9632 [Aphanomyces stellatus]|uniref:Aste57867_9632 protein n=1 Tax=Aphanomyces stellatus TaxID=120398 RepID=A0A485KND6_9STRA|nr:hypothetical protein As57867_009594 [Aphanomyces stellatus]VFT86511.1 Aste57867_9632 [Aphanomyces stellatus]
MAIDRIGQSQHLADFLPNEVAPRFQFHHHKYLTMPLFEQTIPIEATAVEALVSTHYGLTLGARIKASQNHTFQATNDATGTRYSVRVTPDPSGRHAQRIRDELTFVAYVAAHGLDHVCAPIAPTTPQPATHPLSVEVDNLIVAVFNWAKGSPVDFMSFRWMLDASFVKAWGAFFGHLHLLSQRFGCDHPDVACRIQRFDAIHDGVLHDAPLDPLDVTLEADPSAFGVIHGDLNCSNFYWTDSNGLSVYDWDQTMRSWYLYDLAQALFGPIMLAGAGVPIAGTPVPEANPAQYQAWLLEGYASVRGPLSPAQLAHVDRMVALKTTFYERFCRRAQAEGNLPPDMAAFITYIVNWFDKANEAATRAILVNGTNLQTIHLAQNIGILSEISRSVDKHSDQFHAVSSDAQVALRLARLAMSSLDVVAAQVVRSYAARLIRDLFESVDVFLTPTTPITAPAIQPEYLTDGLSDMGTTVQVMRFASWATSLGFLPWLSPWATHHLMPTSMMVQAAHWNEDVMLNVARVIEKHAPNPRQLTASGYFYHILKMAQNDIYLHGPINVSGMNISSICLNNQTCSP